MDRVLCGFSYLEDYTAVGSWSLPLAAWFEAAETSICISGCIEGSPFHLGYHEHVTMGPSQLSPHFPSIILWVHLYGVRYETSTSLYILMEYIMGGTLRHVIKAGCFNDFQCFLFNLSQGWEQSLAAMLLVEFEHVSNINEHMINMNNVWTGCTCTPIDAHSWRLSHCFQVRIPEGLGFCSFASAALLIWLLLMQMPLMKVSTAPFQRDAACFYVGSLILVLEVLHDRSCLEIFNLLQMLTCRDDVLDAKKDAYL